MAMTLNSDLIPQIDQRASSYTMGATDSCFSRGPRWLPGQVDEADSHRVRFSWLFIALLALLGGLGKRSTEAAVAKPLTDEQRPNVLFIAVDDLRPELGCYGDSQVKSPHIDELASQGIVFERAYCQQAVCNPSRASVMTGKRPDSLQVWDLGTDFRIGNPDVVTLPQYLRTQGYRTACIGKIFHNIFPDPASWSEEKFYVDGFPFDPDAVYAGEEQLAWLEQRKQTLIANGRDKQRIDRFGQWYLKASATEAPDCPDNAYYDGAQTDRALAEIRKLSEQPEPFFFAIGFYRPHLPFNAPKQYWELYERNNIQLAPNPDLGKDAPAMAINNMRELQGYYDFREVPRPDHGTLSDDQERLLKHGYLASVSYIDAQIGRLLSELKQLEIDENTIVVLWSDHGWKLGEHNSWGKMTNYEIDARVPLIIRAKGRHPQGATTSRLVELVDLYPTLCELTGVPQPDGLEGTSFVPLMERPNRAWKPAIFHQFLREGIWVAPDGVEYMGYAVRNERHRYVRWVRWSDKTFAAEELYDVLADPHESINLAGHSDQDETLEAMRKQLADGWQAAVVGE